MMDTTNQELAKLVAQTPASSSLNETVPTLVNLKPGAAKKLVIKNCKEKPKLPDNYQQVTWEKLKEAVIAIQMSTSIRYSLEELYQEVENMCKHKMAADVYSSLRDLTEIHVKANIEQFLQDTIDRLIFLKKMNECWLLHCHQMIMIRSIFLYLDRTYVLQNASIHSIWNMGLDLFRQHIVLHTLVQAQMVEGLLILIEKERQGDTVNRTLLKSLLRMLSDLQIYEFETKFLEVTQSLYAAEGNKIIQDLEVPEYLLYVDKRLNEDEDSLLHYLDPTTKWPHIHTVDKQLLSEHLTTTLPKSLGNLLEIPLEENTLEENLLEENRVNKPVFLYTLVTRVKKGLTKLCSKFNNFNKCCCGGGLACCSVFLPESYVLARKLDEAPVSFKWCFSGQYHHQNHYI